jgi:hypothetical protein
MARIWPASLSAAGPPQAGCPKYNGRQRQAGTGGTGALLILGGQIAVLESRSDEVEIRKERDPKLIDV